MTSVTGTRLVSGPDVELAHLVEQCRARNTKTFRGLLDAVADICEHRANVPTLGPITDFRQRRRRGRVGLGQHREGSAEEAGRKDGARQAEKTCVGRARGAQPVSP